MSPTSDHEKRTVKTLLDGMAREDIARLVGRRISQCMAPESHSLKTAWIFVVEFDDGSALQLDTEAIGLEGWNEVGCLRIKLLPNFKLAASEWTFQLKGWAVTDFVISSCTALIYEDATTKVESGIVLASATGRRLIITAGVPPGSVSVLLDNHQQEFDPEFELNEYHQGSFQDAT